MVMNLSGEYLSDQAFDAGMRISNNSRITNVLFNISEPIRGYH